MSILFFIITQEVTCVASVYIVVGENMASSLTGNILFTFILLGLISECYCIPVNQFLPYGTLAGDTVFSKNDDDQSEPGKFSYAFLYFKRTYNNFYVS